MTVATTSAISYREHRDSGKLGFQHRQVLAKMQQEPGRAFSRRELAERTRMDLSSICGRVNELLSLGVLEEAPQRRCEITGKKIKPVRLPKESK
jgi:hypothetical protein